MIVSQYHFHSWTFMKYLVSLTMNDYTISGFNILKNWYDIKVQTCNQIMWNMNSFASLGASNMHENGG